MNTSNQNRVINLAITEGGLIVTEAATRFNMSPRWIYTLLSRYKASGLTAVDRVSRRPHTNPHATQLDMITTIVALRDELTRKGLDAIIINRATGHIIAEHTINPDKNYRPKKPTGGSPHEP